MKNLLFAFAISFVITPGLCMADNIIRTTVPINHAKADTGRWVESGMHEGEWMPISTLCASWIQSANIISDGKSFTQEGVSCVQTEERKLTLILKNNVTGKTKFSSAYTTETRSISVDNVTREAVGTGSFYSIGPITAGSFRYGSEMDVVGLYARTNYKANVGSLVTNEAGDRIQVYLHKANGACSLRFGVTRINGWQPSTVTTATAQAFISRFTYASMFDSYGTIIVDGNLGKITTVDGGAIRAASIPCATFTSIYQDPGRIKYINLGN